MGVSGVRGEELEKRVTIMALLLAAAFLVLVFRLGYLQVVQGSKWEEASLGQRIRVVSIPAPRGNIYDRNGVALATNRPAFSVFLVYTGEPVPEAVVKKLSEILGIEPAVIRKAAEQLKPAFGRPYQPVPIKTDITWKEHTLLEERRADLPGVVVQAQPIRFYPGIPEFPEVGPRLAAHVVGQVKKADYGITAVGRYGLEASYNGDPAQASTPGELGLQGKDGVRQVEVDAQGRPVRTLRELPPLPGNNLVLTIDARLQATAEKALLERMQYLRKLRNKDCPSGCAAEYGAAVAIDVRTGEILVLASVPAFDPNVFALGAAAMPGTDDATRFNRAWRDLNRDPGKPLLNHATMDAAPPGSTFKPVTAVAALEAKVTQPAEKVYCPGYRIFGIRFRDWGAHGSVNLQQALARSCDVYFYEMGTRMGIKALAEMAYQFGLGLKTGLEDRDGISEFAGWVASPETKRRRHPDDPTWYPSQNLSAAIGQDDNQFTPLQMANLAATIANGGVRLRPYLVKQVTTTDGRVIKEAGRQVAGRVKASPASLAEVRKGMLAVMQYNPGWSGVDSSFGTASHVFGDFPAKAKAATGREIRLAGKTGTAETGRKTETPYGWFIGFAPYDNPEIAVAVMVRHGGGGSLAAAPVARAIFEEYFGLHGDREALETAAPVQKKTGHSIL